MKFHFVPQKQTECDRFEFELSFIGDISINRRMLNVIVLLLRIVKHNTILVKTSFICLFLFFLFFINQYVGMLRMYVWDIDEQTKHSIEVCSVYFGCTKTIKFVFFVSAFKYFFCPVYCCCLPLQMSISEDANQWELKFA